MNIDLTSLVTNGIDKLDIDKVFDLAPTYYENMGIRNLEDVRFTGEVKKAADSVYHISGKLSGTMILADDVTLEDVSYSFESMIDENFEDGKNQENNIILEKNVLDITEFLWQNILVEIPLKVHKEGNENMTLKGEGWRLVTEDELEKSNDFPLSGLSEINISRKE